MAGVVDIANEMAHASAYILQQRELAMPGFDIAAMQLSLSQAIVQSIDQLPRLHAEGAGTLTQALRAASYGQDGSHAIASAIHTKLSQPLAHSGSGGGNMFQTLTNINNFLTEDDVNAIRDVTRPHHDRVMIVVRRIRLLGIDHPSGDTIRFAAAYLGLVGFAQYPAYESMYALQQDIAAQIRSALGPRNSGIRTYPSDPSGLPQNVFDVAYPDARPSAVTCDRLHNTARNHVPMKSTSKLLKQSQSVQHAPSQANMQTMTMQSAHQLVGQVVQQQLQGFMHQLGCRLGMPPADSAPQLSFFQQHAIGDAPPTIEAGNQDVAARLSGLFPKQGGKHRAASPASSPIMSRGASTIAPDSQSSHSSPFSADTQTVHPGGLPTLVAPSFAQPSLTVAAPAVHGVINGITGITSPPVHTEGASFVGRSAAGSHPPAEATASVCGYGHNSSATCESAQKRLRKTGKQPSVGIEAIEAALDVSMDRRDVNRANKREATSIIKTAADMAATAAATAAAERLKATCGSIPSAIVDAAALAAVPKAKGKASAGPLSKKLAAVVTPKAPAVKDKDGKYNGKPHYSVEHSRAQVLCRTGVRGDASIKFKFGDHGGREGALRAADEWLATALADVQ